MLNKNDRWQMNRMGFINFWLYDEQDFSFADGKLLLRGANGSGKSITTQSFIPFILDGNTRPERLDPFGSRDRKMDYYIIGVHEKDEATGYLFLEFKKEGSELYRTIGIGLRAQKGKNLTFWGFCLKDGRRVGYDFFLTKDVGNTKLPLAKNELKKEFDVDCFAESGSSYMEMVNRFLFGFPRLEQFDQFIRLLIKVRAPKLSKEFTPTKVYDILNSSLQTLSNEDFRAMVDAMEKMDEIQSRLENYQSGYRDASRIKTEYDRYNNFMLGQKAAAFKSKRDEASQYEKDVNALSSEVLTLERDIKELELNLLGYTQESEGLESEKRTFLDSDLDRQSEIRMKLTQEIDQLHQQVKQEESELDQEKENLNDAHIRYKEEQRKIEEVHLAINNTSSALNEQQEMFQLDSHTSYMNSWKDNSDRNFHRAHQDNVRYLKSQIQQGLDALMQQEDAQDKYSDIEAQWQMACVVTDQAHEEWKELQRLQDEARDNLIESFYRHNDAFELLTMSPQTLQEITKIVSSYEDMNDEKRLRDLVARHHQDIHQSLEKEKLHKEYTVSLLYDAWRQEKKKLQDLVAMKEPVPLRQEKRIEARKALSAAGIPFRSFYEVIDFAQGVDDSHKALIEEQLMDAGVLDALVIPQSWSKQARELLGSICDQILMADSISEYIDHPYLTPAGISLDFDEAARNIIQKISFSSTKEVGSLRLSLDGHYQHGIITGHSIASSDVGYIGVAARLQKRQLQITAQEEVVKYAENALSASKQEVEYCENRISLLRDEIKQLPSTDNLMQSITDTNRQLSIYETSKKTSDQLERNKNIVLDTLHQKRQAVLNLCKGLPYPRKVSSYKEALSAAIEYEHVLIRFLQELKDLEIANTMIIRTADEISRNEDTLDRIHLRLQQSQRKLQILTKELQAVEEVLNQPQFRELAQRRQQIDQRLKQLKELISHQSDDKARKSERIKMRADQLNLLQSRHDEVITAMQTAFKCYEEEIRLGYVIDLKDRSPLDVLKEALSCLRDSDKSRNPEDMYAALHKNYSQHSSYLTQYQPRLEEHFNQITGVISKRYIIRFTWNGQRLSLYEFHKLLKATIDETELLIQAEDRKLFEDILADNLVNKLSYRIMESRRWIRDMSDLMQNIDTSMGLDFALDWRPVTRLDEQELDVEELIKLFNRDRALLSIEDREKISRHFRVRIQVTKRLIEERGEVVNYADLVRDALDYRQWFEFKMYYRRKEKDKKELTNAAFNRFSGGEKAMAMYVPLFAAVSAQYQMADSASPYVIALDEAFAGVDDKNISTMFGLVETLQFGYIMNSQALWGCYETVKALSISELLPSPDGEMITVIPYYWNGKKRSLFEEAMYVG